MQRATDKRKLEALVIAKGEFVNPTAAKRNKNQALAELAMQLHRLEGEKIQVDVPVVVTGESFAGTIAVQDATTVLLEVEATHIPQNIEVSVEGREEGAHITAADLTLPKGAALLADPETLVVAVSVPAAPVEEEETSEDETAEAPAEEAAAEEASE